MKATIHLKQWFHKCNECGKIISGVDKMTDHHKYVHGCQLEVTFTGVNIG